VPSSETGECPDPSMVEFFIVPIWPYAELVPSYPEPSPESMRFHWTSPLSKLPISLRKNHRSGLAIQVNGFCDPVPKYPLMGRDKSVRAKEHRLASLGCYRLLGFVPMASAAESFRSRCGSVRRAPACSSHAFSVAAPQVGQGTDNICLRVSSLLFTAI
jgi:hypothetical protein